MRHCIYRAMWLSLITISLPSIADESFDEILAMQLVIEMDAQSIFVYSCAEAHKCQVRCDAVNNSIVEFDYQRVAEVEFAEGAKHLLVGARYQDAVGKKHNAFSILPIDMICVFDDFELTAVLNAEASGEGRPNDEEVIFEVEPSP